jgi:hypothetical protein
MIAYFDALNHTELPPDKTVSTVDHARASIPTSRTRPIRHATGSSCCYYSRNFVVNHDTIPIADGGIHCKLRKWQVSNNVEVIMYEIFYIFRIHREGVAITMVFVRGH